MDGGNGPVAGIGQELLDDAGARSQVRLLTQGECAVGIEGGKEGHGVVYLVAFSLAHFGRIGPPHGSATQGQKKAVFALPFFIVVILGGAWSGRRQRSEAAAATLGREFVVVERFFRLPWHQQHRGLSF
jgi:hypothetical protein